MSVHRIALARLASCEGVKPGWWRAQRTKPASAPSLPSHSRLPQVLVKSLSSHPSRLKTLAHELVFGLTTLSAVGLGVRHS
jgi:hypothetical protein